MVNFGRSFGKNDANFEKSDPKLAAAPTLQIKWIFFRFFFYLKKKRENVRIFTRKFHVETCRLSSFCPVVDLPFWPYQLENSRKSISKLWRLWNSDSQNLFHHDRQFSNRSKCTQNMWSMRFLCKYLQWAESKQRQRWNYGRKKRFAKKNCTKKVDFTWKSMVTIMYGRNSKISGPEKTHNM